MAGQISAILKQMPQSQLDIVVFGDSHSLKFSRQYSLGRAYQIQRIYDPSGFNSNAAGKFVNALQNSSATNGADFYIKALRSFGIFGFNSTLGRGRCHTPIDKGIAYAESRPIISPILILCATDIDFRGSLLKAILEERFSSKKSLTDIVLSMYGPLFSLVDLLKKRGCNIILEGLIPPTSSDELFALLNGYHGSEGLRGVVYKKVDIIMESVMNSICCPYITYRNCLATDQGLLKEEYHLDGIHVSPKALPIIIDVVMNTHSQSEQNNSCWQHLGEKRGRQRLNVSRSTEVQRLHSSLANDGITIFQMTDQERSSLAQLKEGLDFSDNVGNKHTRYDWTGNSRVPYSAAVKTAYFSQANLLAARDLFLQGRLRNVLSGCLGFEYSIYNIRAFLSSVHSDAGKGPQGFHHDGTPPHLYRAVIYLGDVADGDGAFEYIDHSLQDVSKGNQLNPERIDDAHKVFGGQGTVILFDANRLLHRGSPPIRHHRYVLDLSIGPTPADSENFIIAAGMNNWPCDPYCFSIEGLNIAYTNDDVISKKRLVFNRYPVLKSYYA